jgi:excisionase family DNA binding protein
MSAIATKAAREWITLGAAAQILGVSVPTVRLMIRDGKLSTRQIGYWTRVDKTEVEAIERESVREATAGV